MLLKPQPQLHTPGAIQAHGVLIALDGRGVVTHLSVNAANLLGDEAPSLGHALPEPFGSHIRGLVVRVEEFCDAETEAEMQLDSAFDLLGLYRGVSLDRKSIADGAESAGCPKIRRCANQAAAQVALAEEVRPGATILVKASRGMKFEHLVDYLVESTPECEE